MRFWLSTRCEQVDARRRPPLVLADAGLRVGGLLVDGEAARRVCDDLSDPRR